MGSSFPPEGEIPQEPREPWEPQAPWSAPPPGTPSPGPALPPLAGRWRRLFAGILDAIIVGVISSPLTYGSWSVALDPETGALERINLGYTFLAALIGFLYYWLLHAYWNGQTLGKKLFGMRVVQETGQRITVGQAAVRQLVELVLASLCCLGIVDLGWILFDPRKQALHDKAAKTLVVDA